MGLLTGDSSASKSSFGRGFQRASKPLSVFLYIGGMVYFAVNIWPAFNHETYMSENSLLPGVADETFDLIGFVNDKLDALENIVKKETGSKRDEIPYQWLHKEFIGARLEAQVQNFTVRYPLGLSREYSGRNVFGVVRAARGASNEAIVIAVPYGRKMLPAVAVALALAKFAQHQVFWAKDLIFVVTEKEEIGMQAWLNSYHGKASTEFLVADEMSIHSGPIQAAVCLELSRRNGLTRSEISYNMINGQLPNLDLVNVAVRLANRHHSEPVIHDIMESHVSYSWDGYSRLMTTALRGVWRQAVGPKSGLHQVFGQFNIEAVTVRPRRLRGSPALYEDMDVVKVAKMMEGILRSINNLLERFHQSFFFYLLLSPYRYMSIGIYMPAVGAMLLAPLMIACALWLRVTSEEEEGQKKDEQNKGEPNASKDGEGLSKEEKTSEASSNISTDKQKMEDQPKGQEHSVWDVAPYFIAAHVFGLVIRLIPDFAQMLLQYLGVSVVRNEYVIVVAAVVAFYSFCFPVIMKKLYKLRGFEEAPSTNLFRCLCLLELGVVVGVISVVNFGLGFLLCLTWVPVFSIIAPCKKRWEWPLKFTPMILANPFVVLYLAHFVWMGPSNWFDPAYILDVAKATMDSIFSMIVDNYFYGSWMFTIVTAVLYPLWMQFWALLYFHE